MTRSLVIGSVYLALWYLLDEVALHFEVVPEVQVWCPASALDVVLLLVFGLRFWPALLLNTFVHVYFVTHRPLAWATFSVYSIITTVGYTGACYLLRRLKIDVRLSSLRDVTWFMGIAGLGAPLFISVLQAVNFAGSGIIPHSAFVPSLLQYWAGEATGVGMLAPFLLLLLRRFPHLWHDAAEQQAAAIRQAKLSPDSEFEEAAAAFRFGPSESRLPPVQGWETAAQFVLLCAAIWLGYGMESIPHLDYRYLVFVPLIWIAVRHGFVGASASLVFFNVAAGILVHRVLQESNGLALQFGLMIVTFTGILLGAFISERNRLSEAVRYGRERFSLIANATSDALWEWNLLSGRVWRNENNTALFGHTPTEMKAEISWWESHIHPEDRAEVTRSIQRAIDGTQDFWSDEYRYLRADGGVARVLDRGRIVRDPAGKAILMVGGIVDVTAQHEAEERLRHSAYHDALTGLPNRAFFLESLQNSLNLRE